MRDRETDGRRERQRQRRRPRRRERETDRGRDGDGDGDETISSSVGRHPFIDIYQPQHKPSVEDAALVPLPTATSPSHAPCHPVQRDAAVLLLLPAETAAAAAAATATATAVSSCLDLQRRLHRPYGTQEPA